MCVSCTLPVLFCFWFTFTQDILKISSSASLSQGVTSRCVSVFPCTVKNTFTVLHHQQIPTESFKTYDPCAAEKRAPSSKRSEDTTWTSSARRLQPDLVSQSFSTQAHRWLLHYDDAKHTQRRSIAGWVVLLMLVMSDGKKTQKKERNAFSEIHCAGI